jgi:hypothetical protein
MEAASFFFFSQKKRKRYSVQLEIAPKKTNIRKRRIRIL